MKKKKTTNVRESWQLETQKTYAQFDSEWIEVINAGFDHKTENLSTDSELFKQLVFGINTLASGVGTQELRAHYADVAEGLGISEDELSEEIYRRSQLFDKKDEVIRSNNPSVSVNPFQEGDILYAQGYCHTVFYQVLKTTAKTITIRELQTSFTPFRWTNQEGYLMPIPEAFKETRTEMTKMVLGGPKDKKYVRESSYHITKWDGVPGKLYND